MPIDLRIDRDFANPKPSDPHLPSAHPGAGAAASAVATKLARLLSRQPRRSIAALASEAQSCAESLARQAGDTEPAFLELGNDLRVLHESATTLTGAIEQAIARLHGSLTTHRIAGDDGAVAGAVQAVEAGVATVDTLLGRSQTISACLHALAPQLEAIGKVGVLLQSVAVCFSVESSRTAESAAAFGSFVAEIRGLSRRIGEVERRISDGLSHACGVGSSALAELERELGALRLLAERLAAENGRAAALVQAKLDEIVAAMAELRERSRQIGRHTEDAIFHMQFGDIVRQKIEHTVAALGDIASLLRQSPAGKRTALRGPIGSLAIQAAQLELVEDELRGAADRIGTAFLRITETAAGLSRHDAARPSCDGSIELREMLGGFGHLQGLLKQAGALQQQADASGREALSTAEHIAEQMREVQDINREMHLLALNAIVKTAALGSSGATLEVLSMQVHDLYRQADAAVVEIDNRARNLGERDAEAKDGGDGLLAAGERLSATLGEIGRSAGEHARTADLIAENGAAHGEHLHAAETRLSALATFADQLHRLRDRVLALRAELVLRSGDTAEPAASPTAEDHLRYTMQSERDVHRRLAEASPAAKSITASEPDGSASLESAKAAAYPTDDDGRSHAPLDAARSPFGENVELF